MHRTNDSLLQFLAEKESVVVIAGNTTPDDTLPASLSVALVATSLKKDVSLVIQQSIPHHLTLLRFDAIIASSSFSLKKTSFTVSSQNHTIANAYYAKQNNDLQILLTDTENKTIPHTDITVSASKNTTGVVAIGCTPQEIEKIQQENSLSEQELFMFHRTEPQISYCELVTQALKQNRDLITKDVATALMTGIIITSDNFKSIRTTPQCLFTAAYLTACGAEREKIVRTLYTIRSFAFIQAWGVLLNRFHYNAQSRGGYTYLHRHEIQEGHLNHNEIPSLLNELRNTTPYARFVIIGIHTEKTLVCMGSIIEGSPSPLVRHLGITMRGSSFSIPIRVRTSIHQEMNALEKTISSLIV